MCRLSRKRFSAGLAQFTATWMDENHYDCPSEINRGQCEDFAWAYRNLLKELFGESAVREIFVAWDDELFDPPPGFHGGHCMLVWKGVFYDAECPDGVISMADLPFYQRITSNENARERTPTH